MLADAWYTEKPQSQAKALETLVDLMRDYYPNTECDYATTLVTLHRSPENIPAFAQAMRETVLKLIHDSIADIDEERAKCGESAEQLIERSMLGRDIKKLEQACSTLTTAKHVLPEECTEYDALMAIVSLS